MGRVAAAILWAMASLLAIARILNEGRLGGIFEYTPSKNPRVYWASIIFMAFFASYVEILIVFCFDFDDENTIISHRALGRSCVCQLLMKPITK